MGANPYCYFTAYNPNIEQALAALREQEFQAGRYNPALLAADPPSYTFQHSFPPDEHFPSPGAQHSSIEEAFAEGMESASGTGSILDIIGISQSPQMLHASPSTHQALVALFCTSSPAHGDVERCLLAPVDDQLMKSLAFWEEIGRGECRYFVIYEDGAPAELFFAGMSID